MALEFDIIVAGGGLNGSALALALAQSEFSVALIDPLEDQLVVDDEFDGRSYALAVASQRLLGAIGIWEQVAENAQPILEVVVSDGRAGEGASPLILELDHAEIEEGPMGFMIEDRYLRQALHRSIADNPLIRSMRGVRVQSQSVASDGVTVCLSSGKSVTASLLIGCDGRNTQIGEGANIKREGWSYGQTALVCAISHERPHNGTAHQFFMPHGPLAILPLPGNRSSIVWSETTSEAERIHALSDADYIEALKPRFGDFLGKIALCGQRATYPLGLSLAQSTVAERLVLVGDAAHVVHPITGQGLNSGLKDIAALAEVLTMAMRRGEDIGRMDVLERYRKWRSFDVSATALATDTFNRVFSNDNPTIRLGRDLGLGLVNALPGLRRNLMREAAGLTGDLPKLLQGRAI
ncbi:MAG TPA: 2-octaprenyl-6-methoxyphenyl hydroxylase [Octadecabacter sp.]|nr:2-octaprenyl-6-methoxyphenyl hydroxylase [Octadecabacter sp.]